MKKQDCHYLNEAAECLKVLAHPTRLLIVSLLRKQSMSVGEIAQHCEIQSHMASEHLRLMLRCGFLNATRSGRSISYEIAEPHLLEILKCIESRFKGKNKQRYNYVNQ